MLDARLLVAHVLELDEAGLILAGGDEIDADKLARIDGVFHRRQSGEPVAHIIGEKEFFGLNFALAPGVLTPRPDTETLVEAVLSHVDKKRPCRILELGVGTGCVLISLLTALPKAVGIGVDRREGAAILARRNAHQLCVSERCRFLVGDWASAIEAKFDVIISNPPYIPDGDKSRLARDVVEYEDHGALFAGCDGLDAYRSIMPELPRLAGSQTIVGFEVGRGQDVAVGALLADHMPGAKMHLIADLSAINRVVLGVNGQV